MIPLLVTGAISLANNVVEAWKTHSDNVAMSKAIGSADFQQTLKTAVTKAVSSAQQQQQAALPADLQQVTGQILQSPSVQSMARVSPTGGLSFQFNSSGQLFTTQASGGVRQVNVTPEVQAELRQLNGTMRHSAVGAYAGAAQVSGQIAGRLPVQVTLAAV